MHRGLKGEGGSEINAEVSCLNLNNINLNYIVELSMVRENILNSTHVLIYFFFIYMLMPSTKTKTLTEKRKHAN